MSAMVCKCCGVKIFKHNGVAMGLSIHDLVLVLKNAIGNSRDPCTRRMSACLPRYLAAQDALMSRNAGELLIYLRLSWFLAATQTYTIYTTLLTL